MKYKFNHCYCLYLFSNFHYPVQQCRISILNVCVIVFRATPSYSFVDYLRGGCEMNLIVAIDFTVRVYPII